MISNISYYERLCRLSKKEVVQIAGYKNIKEAYRDLGNSKTLSKKYLARMVAF